MKAKVELPKAFSVRDNHEFFPIQHLLDRMNPRFRVKRVATGVHVHGGATAYWGLVYLDGEPPSKTSVEAALADPEHEEHESYMEWRGSFDPEAFDAQAATKMMRRGLPNWRKEEGM